MSFYPDVMIDLETLGNGPDAAVIQAGAAYFNIDTGDVGKTLKIDFDFASAQKSGGKIDAKTVQWWLGQSPEARASILTENRKTAVEGFVTLNNFLEGADHIWSHATFDFVIVSETLKRLDIKPRFAYRAARDIRTLVYLSGLKSFKKERQGVHHDALDDCLYQVAYCVEAWNVIKNRNLNIAGESQTTKG